MPTSLPRAPLPPVITSSIPGTWAYDTMSRRVREDILARIFRENNFDDNSYDRLKVLDSELENAHSTILSPITDDGGPDVHIWNNQILAPYFSKKDTWLSAPWAIAEFYLYRRIMTAIDYFSCKIDPFSMQKELGLTSAIDSIVNLASRVNQAVESCNINSKNVLLNQLRGFVLTSLWGNRMDLSLWPVGIMGRSRAAESFQTVLEAGQRMILANDIDSLISHIENQQFSKRIDIIVDNAGFELFSDLCLADFLLAAGFTQKVHLQLKAHPTFVSDAMSKDVQHTIKFLQQRNGSETSQINILGDRWAKYVTQGQWILNENYFWVQPQPFWDMPPKLREDLAETTVVFVKGDANYRRLLGDRMWELDTKFSDVTCYFPAPVCALRTLKAELGCGMTKEQTTRAANEDDSWMVAGKYGVVQFCDTTQIH